MLLAHDHDLCLGVLGVFLEVVFAWYRARLGLPHGQPGAITGVQRFSSTLAIDPHFYSIVLDGLFARDEASGARDPRYLASSTAAATEPRWREQHRRALGLGG